VDIAIFMSVPPLVIAHRPHVLRCLVVSVVMLRFARHTSTGLVVVVLLYSLVALVGAHSTSGNSNNNNPNNSTSQTTYYVAQWRHNSTCSNVGSRYCPYSSLQSAIDNASTNDSIIIEPGHYVESVVINKDLMIVYGINITCVSASNTPLVSNQNKSLGCGC
jgi:hypothetical protein